MEEEKRVDAEGGKGRGEGEEEGGKGRERYLGSQNHSKKIYNVRRPERTHNLQLLFKLRQFRGIRSVFQNFYGNLLVSPYAFVHCKINIKKIRTASHYINEQY
jgi:hypothetical protein